MNVFTLIVITKDYTNGEFDVLVANYATVEAAKEQFDAQLQNQIDIFEDIGEVFSIDQSYEADTPESEMTGENCFDVCVHNDNGLSVSIQIVEMPVH